MRGLKMAIFFGLCLWLTQISAPFVHRAQAATLFEISELITPEARRDYDDIISRFAADIADDSIKFREDSGAIFIRLEDERFCILSSCVTIVTTRCGHPACQYVPVLVPPRYGWVGIGGRFWGNLIEFPATRTSSPAATLVFNRRFIAAYHAL
jgi:hypothetical protein